MTVEPDLSNAQPFLAAALITGGTVTVPDWPRRTTQPGDALRRIFTEMGGSCELTDAGLVFTGTGKIHGIDVDLGEVGELTPGIAAVAALADSESVLRGVAHLRLHETDRLAALTMEINGLGGDVTETADGLRIRPRPLRGGTFHTYDDHRMATMRRGDRPRGGRRPHRERGDDRQDPAGLPADVGRHARPNGPGRGSVGPVMRRYGKHTDEDDIRQRPNPKGNRPRTSIRPKHEDAAEGFVLTVDRGRLTCLVEDRTVHAMKARELGRKAAVVGDRVWIVGDLSGKKDTLARIVRIEERKSVLRRTADDDDPYERVVVANADQLAIVTALADPEPRPRMIDRCLVAAYDAGLEPLLVLTKSDLTSADKILEIYSTLGVNYVVTNREELATGDAAERVRERLNGRITAFVGHSGVGKTTLVNSLVAEGRQRATGHVNAVTGRGRRHHHLGARAAAALGRRLGHRHPGRALLRPAPRGSVPGDPGLPGPGAGDGGLPARL